MPPPPSGNGRGRKRDPNGPPGSNKHYPHSFVGGCDGYNGAPGRGDDGLPDDPYGADSDGSSSPESKRRYTCDQYTQQHDQFKQTMIAMINSLIDMLHCQWQTQNNTACALHVTHQSQKEHSNDYLIDNKLIFDGKPECYFDWILKLENAAVVTKWNAKEVS